MVTAERRSTNLQRTPIAVTALDGDALADAQITNLQGVAALVPSFRVGDIGGYAQVSIRGIGSLSAVPLTENPVAVNLNEIYISRPVSVLSGLFDVATVEVLRGPQGTLYGRNATAGSVNITTARPETDLAGFARLTYGNYDAKRAEGAIGGALSGDTVLLRVAGFVEDRDGYGTNVATGRDIDDKRAWGLRGTLVLRPTEQLEATLIAERYRQKDRNAALHYFGGAGTIPVSGAFGSAPFATLFGGTVLTNSYDVSNDVDPRFYLGVTTLSGIVEYDPDGPLALKSITGYRRQRARTLSDLDNSDLPLGLLQASENARQFSQELQARYDTERLNITAGLYYFREKDDAAPYVAAVSSATADPILASLGIVLPPRPQTLLNFGNLGGTIDTHAAAAFAQGTWEVVENLSVTAGLRYSRERRRLIQRYLIDVLTPYDPDLPPPPGLRLPSRTFSAWTPRFGLQYQFDSRTLLYATYARGFKSGSFDPSADPATTTDASYGPEKLSSYEIGVKTTMLDNRLRANLAAFYYDYTGLQVLQTRGLGIVTSNAGKARQLGIEGEFTVIPARGLELALSGSYLDSKYLNYLGIDAVRVTLPEVRFDGHRLNNSPSISGLASAQYTHDLSSGKITGRGELEFTSKYFFSPGNYDELSQGGYGKLNAFVTYGNNAGWSLSAFGRNLTDRKTKTSGQVQTIFLGVPITGNLAPPQTYGLAFEYRF